MKIQHLREPIGPVNKETKSRAHKKQIHRSQNFKQFYNMTLFKAPKL